MRERVDVNRCCTSENRSCATSRTRALVGPGSICRIGCSLRRAPGATHRGRTWGRYTEKREAAEHAFQQKLMDAELLGSGIPEFGNGREVIEPSLWELLEIQYFYFDEAPSEGRKYEKLEFFEISAIPLNIRLIPEWLDGELGARGYVEFRHDRDYRHVSLRGIDYTLSDLHSKIVKLLHQAFLRGEEWQHGVKVLGEAGSRQFKMGDVLKSRDDWQSLIESDGKGMYRLKIRLDETAS